jgi:cholesterol transport system auxiliary component
MNRSPSVQSLWLCVAACAVLLTAGCGGLLPKPAPQPSFYSLDGAGIVSPTAARGAAVVADTAPTLVVNPPRAAAGYDSQHIMYVRVDHKLEYFAHSEWIDTPARMLAPLLVAALENGGAFRAVVPTPSAAAGDIRLDTEILRLQHNFGPVPSAVRFTLRAYLVDNATRRVLAWREFDETVPSASEDPAGGVTAANRAVQAVLKRLASFCADTAGKWSPGSPAVQPPQVHEIAR